MLYVAKPSFYDSEVNYDLCAGKNKKKVIRRAVEILEQEHAKGKFPSWFFGNRSQKITSHFVKLIEVEFVE